MPHQDLYQERRIRETGELESRLAALEELLSELVPTMEARGYEAETLKRPRQ